MLVSTSWKKPDVPDLKLVNIYLKIFLISVLMNTNIPDYLLTSVNEYYLKIFLILILVNIVQKLIFLTLRLVNIFELQFFYLLKIQDY